MDSAYAPYVAPELLDAWKSDPQHAPGRLTSSPSPDRIGIRAVQMNADGSYVVTGTVIETASGAKRYQHRFRHLSREPGASEAGRYLAHYFLPGLSAFVMLFISGA